MPSKNPEVRHAWYLRNREKVLERAALRYRANPKEKIAKSKQYRQQNREKERAWAARFRAKNRDAINKKNKERYRKDKEKILIRLHESYHKRRAAKLNSLGNPASIAYWMKEIRTKPFVRCHWCGTKVSGRKIHFDHIIPLSRNGTHTIGNLCAACADCNLSKNARLIPNWIVNGQRFLNL